MPRKIEERFIKEDEHWRYYERYVDGLLDTPFMMLKEPIWFLGKTADVLEKHCHVKLDPENIERFENLFERDIVEGYYYMNAVCSDGHSDEVVKWIFGPITIKINETGQKISQVCRASTLRSFVNYLVGDKFPKHFAKDIFDILLEKRPLPHKIIPLLDEIAADPRFATMDTSVVDEAVAVILAANPNKVIEAKENPKLAQWFVGQTLKANKGMSPVLVKEAIERQILARTD